MPTLNLCPVVIDACFSRGDNPSFSYTMKDPAGVAIDITGFDYELTVDPSAEPANADNNLFVLTGTVPTGTDGVVQFNPTVLNHTQTPSTYFYDVQEINLGGARRTVVKGEYELQQDINKT